MIHYYKYIEKIKNEMDFGEDCYYYPKLKNNKKIKKTIEISKNKLLNSQLLINSLDIFQILNCKIFNYEILYNEIIISFNCEENIENTQIVNKLEKFINNFINKNSIKSYKKLIINL